MKEDSYKICLTTVVTGNMYQEYIPFLLYSCHKAYPEYDMVIFVHGKLKKNVRESIEYLSYDNVKVKENQFESLKKGNRLAHKCLRWVLWDELFLNYDYLYVVDIDILYFKEPIPLHLQHIEHMKRTGLCFDNIQRSFVRNPFNLIQLFSRIKRAGFLSMREFLFGDKLEKKVSGLHFVNVKSYYSKMSVEKLNMYENEIVSGNFQKYIMSPSDEIFLYYMLSKENMEPEKLPIATDSVRMLDYRNYTMNEFRPHHGIHMGIFRKKDYESDSELDSFAYQYYLNQYKVLYSVDSEFQFLLRNSDPIIQSQFERLKNYCNCTVPSSKSLISLTKHSKLLQGNL